MSESAASDLNQYLTFTLSSELFALDIGSVREILDHTKITRIPRTPEFMRGVINLRGNAVPVVDLRLKFGMSKNDSNNSCVIITEVDFEQENTLIGALADEVQEVLEIEPAGIDPAPRMGTAIRSKYIKGMGKHGERFVIILDVAQLFSPEELSIARAPNRAQD
jgi:purine-binding chemotaxis protein CheW